MVRLCLALVIDSTLDFHPGLTHRITLVAFGDRLQVADVGSGVLGPAVSVTLSAEEAQNAHRSFRVVRLERDELHLQTLENDAWFSLCRFELAQYGQADCVLGHFHSHRHPDAMFVNNLVAARMLGSEVRSFATGCSRFVLQRESDRRLSGPPTISGRSLASSSISGCPSQRARRFFGGHLDLSRWAKASGQTAGSNDVRPLPLIPICSGWDDARILACARVIRS